MKLFFFTIYMFIAYAQAYAQASTVIDNKGTIIKTNNLVTTATTAPNNPIHGDVWFDTTTNITRVWDGVIWKGIVGNTIGDIKYGFETTDHDGWIKLDGRAISTLTDMQQAQAAILNFSGNLPNAEDRTLMMRSIGNVGDVGGGNNTVQILQQNLPNVTLPVTIASAGNHNHTYLDLNPNTPLQSGYRGTALKRNRTSITRTTSTNTNNHSHTVNLESGGNDTPLNITPSFLHTSVFIFLGY